MPETFSYPFSLADADAAAAFAVKHSLELKRRITVVRLLAIVALTVWALSAVLGLEINDQNSPALGLGFMPEDVKALATPVVAVVAFGQALVAALAWWFLCAPLARLAARRQWRRDVRGAVFARNFGPHELALAAEGFCITTPGIEVRVAWWATDKLELTASHAFLVVGPRVLAAVPLAALGERREDFVATLARFWRDHGGKGRPA